MQNILFVWFYLENHLCLESEIRPIKCLNIYHLSDGKINKKNLCVLRATDCPVFEVKAKSACRYLLTSSIDQNRSIIVQTDSDLWSIQKLEQDLMMLQKISLQIIGFLW